MDWIPLGTALDGTMSEPCIHPVSGRMIIPAITGNSTNLYEAVLRDSALHIDQVATIESAGEWSAKTAAVGDHLYLGVGKHQDGQDADEVPGLIYEITAKRKEA
jgi:hypothetical protein